MEKISQENTFDTAIDFSSETKESKDDVLNRTKQHRENVDKIIVPQYIDYQYVKDNDYAVTYSKKDNSLLGWTINIEQNGQQLPHVYFNLDQSYDIKWFKLCKKTLLFCYHSGHGYRKYLFCYKKCGIK